MFKITPVLIVDAIEPCLNFWVDQLGFQKIVEVPHDGRIGFVILVKENTEVMIQTTASTQADTPGIAPAAGGACLYIEVENVQETFARLKNPVVLVPFRDTFYGMKEIFVREPGGNMIGFASKAGQ